MSTAVPSLQLKSNDCGSFACFYKPNELGEVLFSNVKAITAFTLQDDVPIPVSGFNAALRSALALAPGIGVRIEGIAASEPHIEALQAFANAKAVYDARLPFYTTYAPCPLAGEDVFVILLSFRTPVQLTYNRKGLHETPAVLSARAVVLSMHQSCAVNLADIGLTPDMFGAFMAQIKESLDIVHDQGKYHGDVKLRNMVTCSDRAKLIDFPGKTQAKNDWYRITEAGIQPTDFTKTYRLRVPDGAADIPMEAALYDRVCFNLIVANFVETNDLSSAFYAALAYKDATEFIKAHAGVTTLYSFGEVVEHGLAYIRRTYFFGGAMPRRTAARIDIASRQRVVWKGARGVQYVKMKGAFVAVAALRAASRVKTTAK